MPAGELRERIAFDEIAEDETSYGVAAGDWDEMFRRAARIRRLVGGEPVIAERLTGVQPVVITVRSDSDTRTVTTAWRIRDVRTSAAYQIRAVTADEKRRYIDFLCEIGPATNG